MSSGQRVALHGIAFVVWVPWLLRGGHADAVALWVLLLCVHAYPVLRRQEWRLPEGPPYMPPPGPAEQAISRVSNIAMLRAEDLPYYAVDRHLELHRALDSAWRSAKQVGACPEQKSTLWLALTYINRLAKGVESALLEDASGPELEADVARLEAEVQAAVTAWRVTTSDP